MPGPGTYDVKQLVGNESTAKSLHSKLSPAFQRPGANAFPGPGTYESPFQSTKKMDPQWRMGTSKRDDNEKTKSRVMNYPPPGSYNPNYRASVKGDPRWGFGSSKRAGLSVGKTVSPGM